MKLQLVLFIVLFCTATSLQGQSLDKLLLDYSNTADSVERADLEHRLAWAYQEQQAFSRAIEFYTKALAKLKSDTLQAQKIRASMIYCFGELRDRDSEIRVREEMLNVGIRDKQQLISNIQGISSLYVSTKNYPKAISYNEQLLNIGTELKDYKLISQAYNNLGYIYHLQNDPVKSSDSFNKSYQIVNEQGGAIKDDDRAKILINLGVVNATLGNLDATEKQFDEALQIVRRQKDPVKIANALNFSATGFYLKGFTAKAITTLNEGIELLEKAPETDETNAVRSDCYKLMAELMLKKNNISTFKLYQKKYESLQAQSLQQEKRRNRLLADRQLDMERQERDIQRLFAENQRNRVQLVESELVTLQKEKELKQKLSELELLRNESEIQTIRIKNQELEKERISSLLEIAQQRTRDVEQRQRIDSLQRDKELQELSLQKSKKEIELLENTQKQQVKLKEYSYIIIGLLVFLLGIAVRLYFYRNKKNRILAEQNFQISSMNQEILAQNEELTLMNDVLNERTDQVEKQNQKLTEAQEIINEQNDTLLSYNRNLELEIEKRMKEIKITNSELVHYNNQLEQFAFTVSHNLRGPIARLLGLTSLLGITTDPVEREFMISKIDQSSKDLDEIITDLTRILEIKNTEQKILEPIDLKERMSKATMRLESIIRESNATITSDFSNVKVFLSATSCIDSVFYNLISNSVKYRSRKRPCVIEVKGVSTEESVVLTFQDNGIGIDLEKYGHQLFGLYKRFDTQTEGRGLGLYLVKAEVEALNGLIEVKSELDKGTTFKITLPSKNPKNVLKEMDEVKVSNS